MLYTYDVNMKIMIITSSPNKVGLTQSCGKQPKKELMKEMTSLKWFV